MKATAVVALRATAEEAMVEQEVVRQMRVLAEACRAGAQGCSR